MEIVGQSLRHTGTSANSVRFPSYIRIALYVLTAMTIIVSGSIMASRREMSDPFSTVSDLFTGDARQVALAHGFTCQNAGGSDYPATLSDSCIQHNTDPLYSGIYLQTSANIVNEVSFFLRENTLALGDLVLLWGKPETRPYCETLVLSWPTHQLTAVVAVPRTRNINYFAPILMISFVRWGLPDWGRELLNDAWHGC